MKVYLAFDLEGSSGTSIRSQMRPDNIIPGLYSRAQRLATEDVKSAVDGILEVDPDAEILFNDGHGYNMNVFFEELPENVSIVLNSRELYDEVLGLDDSFDALICIGAHGHPLIPDAVLCHVWNAREVKFNGKSLTETGLDASLAGYYGVPLVAVSGDEASVSYIKNNISQNMATAVVKRGIGQYNAICLNPKKAQKLIKKAVIDGLKRRDEVSPLTYENPIEVEITYPTQFNAYATNHFLGDDRVSATTVKFEARNAKEAYYKFLTRRKISAPR